MSPACTKLQPADFRTSAWSGGTTTQLIISPPEANYGERNFLWRISSARVELETSEFTSLPDYDRLIATLQGTITLSHNGGAPISLPPYRVHSFSGADRTHCEGRCTDFNLMLRRGQAAGSMEALEVPQDGQELTAEGDQLLLYCAAGSCTAVDPMGSYSLAPGEALLMEGPGTLQLTGPGARLMCCRMRRL